MNTTLRDFIDSRETAIKEQIKALRAELAEIKLARQALNGGAQDLQTSPNNSSPTIKEMVRTILDAAPSGLTAHQILEKINSDYGKDIERTSLSPQLSRLKSDNEVFLDGDMWMLGKHWLEKFHKHDNSEDEVVQEPGHYVNFGEEDDDIDF